MYYQRGTWFPDKGIKDIQDILHFNDIMNWGTTTMKGKKTLSWQRFYPNQTYHGFNLSSFATDAAKKTEGRKPAILELQIPDEHTYDKYKQHLKIVLTRGQEDDITSDTSIVTVAANLVDANPFPFREFLKYRGELFIDIGILSSGIKLIEDLKLSVYESKEHEYYEFTEAYKEGRVKTLYTPEDIVRILSHNSIEGNQGFNR